jgi:hypothetical protein
MCILSPEGFLVHRGNVFDPRERLQPRTAPVQYAAQHELGSCLERGSERNTLRDSTA